MPKNPCSCIRDTFSIEITQLSSQKMVIHDCSNWVVEEGFVVPDSYVITLKHPNKSVSSHTLGRNSTLIEGDFEDGVYFITLDNCGVVYSSEFLYTATMQCKLDNIIASGDPKKLDLALDIQKDLKSAQASARVGDIKTAEDIYKQAELKLSNLSCDCTC